MLSSRHHPPPGLPPGCSSPPLSHSSEGSHAPHGDAGRTRLLPLVGREALAKAQGRPWLGQDAGSRRKVGQGAEAAERGAQRGPRRGGLVWAKPAPHLLQAQSGHERVPAALPRFLLLVFAAGAGF